MRAYKHAGREVSPLFRGAYSEKLVKRAKRGNCGDPVATIAFYGPDDTRASKLVVAIVPEDPASQGLVAEKKWYSETTDLRWDDALCREVLAFIDQHKAPTVVMPEVIIGCPHEEGKEYPEGEACPQCPFWAGRDRFAGTPLAQDAGDTDRAARAALLARLAAEGRGHKL